MREGMFARLTVFAPDQVGVSRAPADSFLGLPTAPRSLRLDRAESVLNLLARPARAEVILAGTLGAPEAFPVSGQTVRIRFGPRETEVQLDARGIGQNARAHFRVTNAEETGLAHGGRLDFELALRGADWLDGLSTRSAAPAARTAPLALEVGSARHTADAHLTSRVIER
jgi:hypothetical protein